MASIIGPALASLALMACFDPGGGDGTGAGSSSTTGSDGGPVACVPGELSPCVCPTGAGNQECNAEGTAFGACECIGSGSTGPSSTGPGPTSSADTTTDADSSTGPSDSTTGGESSGTTMGVSGPGSSSGSSSDGGPGDTGPLGPMQVGEDCMSDADCVTGVCWDFNDYDPFCFGSACSVLCQSDADCSAAMAAAGAPDPNGGGCGADGRCETLGTGFGQYVCAAPAP